MVMSSGHRSTGYNAGHTSRPSSPGGHSSAGGGGHKSGGGHSQVGDRPAVGTPSHRSGSKGHTSGSGSGTTTTTPVTTPKTVSERLKEGVAFKGIVGTKVKDSSGKITYGGSAGAQFGGSIDSGKGVKRKQTYIGGKKVSDTDRVQVKVGAKQVWATPKSIMEGKYSVMEKQVKEAQLKKKQYEGRAYVPSKVQRATDRGLTIGTAEVGFTSLLKPSGMEESVLQATRTPVVATTRDEFVSSLKERQKKAARDKAYGIQYVDESIIPVARDTDFVGPKRLTEFEKMISKPFGEATKVGYVPKKKESKKPLTYVERQLQGKTDSETFGGVLQDTGTGISNLVGKIYGAEVGIAKKFMTPEQGYEFDEKERKRKEDKKKVKETGKGVIDTVVSGAKNVGMFLAAPVTSLWVGKEVSPERQSRVAFSDPTMESDARKIADIRGRISYQRSLPAFQRDEKETKNLEVESEKLRASLNKKYPGMNIDNLISKDVSGPMISLTSTANISQVREDFDKELVKSKQEGDYERRVKETIKTGQSSDMTQHPAMRNMYLQDLQIYEQRKKEGRMLLGEGDAIAKMGGIDTGREMIEFPSSFSGKLPEPIDIETTTGVRTAVPYAPIKEDMFGSLIKKKDDSIGKQLWTSFSYRDVEGKKKREKLVDEWSEPIEKKNFEELGEIRELSLSEQVKISGKVLVLGDLQTQKSKLADIKENKEMRELLEKDISFVGGLEGDGALENLKDLSPKITELQENIVGTEGRVGLIKDKLAQASIDNDETAVVYFTNELKLAETKHTQSPVIGYKEKIKDMEKDLSDVNYPQYLSLIKGEGTDVDKLNILVKDAEKIEGKVKKANLNLGELQEEQKSRIENINKLREQSYKAKLDIVYEDPLEREKEKAAEISGVAFEKGDWNTLYKSKAAEIAMIVPDISRKMGRALTTPARVTIGDIKEGEYGKVALGAAAMPVQFARGVYDWTKPKKERFVDWDTVEGAVDVGLMGFGAASGFAKATIGKEVVKQPFKQVIKKAAIKGGIGLGIAGVGEVWQTAIGKQTWQRGLSDTATNIAKLAILSKMMKLSSKAGAEVKIQRLQAAKDQAVQELIVKQTTFGHSLQKGDVSKSVFLQQGKATKSVNLRGTPYRMEYKLNPRLQEKAAIDTMTKVRGTMSPQYRIFKGDKLVIDWTNAPTVTSLRVGTISPEGSIVNQQIGAPGRVPDTRHYEIGRDLFVMKEGKKIKYFLSPTRGAQSTSTVVQIQNGPKLLAHTGRTDIINPLEITKQQYTKLLAGKDLNQVFSLKDAEFVQKVYNVALPGQGYAIVDKGYVAVRGGKDLVVDTSSGKQVIQQVAPFKGISTTGFEKTVYYGPPGTTKVDLGAGPTGVSFQPKGQPFWQKFSFKKIDFGGIFKGKKGTVALTGGGDDVLSTGRWTGSFDDVIGKGIGGGKTEFVTGGGPIGAFKSLQMATLPTIQYASTFTPSLFGVGTGQFADYFSRSEILPSEDVIPQTTFQTDLLSTSSSFGKTMALPVPKGKTDIIIDEIVKTGGGGGTSTDTVPVEITIPIDETITLPTPGGGSLLGPLAMTGLGGGLGWGLPPLLAGMSGKGRGKGYGMGETSWLVTNPIRNLWGEFQQRQMMKQYQPSPPTSREIAQGKLDTMFGAVKGLNAEKATKVTLGGMSGMGAMAALQTPRPAMGSQQPLQRGSPDLFGTKMMGTSKTYGTKLSEGLSTGRTTMRVSEKIPSRTSQRKRETSSQKTREARISKMMAAPKKGKDPKVLSYRRRKVRI